MFSIMDNRFAVFSFCILDADRSQQAGRYLLVNPEEVQGFALFLVPHGMGETSSSTSHSSQDPSLLGYGFHGAIANSTPNFL